MLETVDAPGLGRNVRYGLGVIAGETRLGRMLGHSGFFPGYVTQMGYFVDSRLAFGWQVNGSDFAAWKRAPSSVLIELAALATGVVETSSR